MSQPNDQNLNSQNLSNHARYDPVFHGFLFVAVLVFLGAAVYQMYQEPNWWNAGRILGVIWLLTLMLKTRLYAMKVQDRLIRLEERLRLSQLLPDSTRGRIGELTEGQLVALRFASDAEIPGVVEKTLAGNWNQKQIKQSIKTWRPDYWRV
ncbi:MAG: DUF6526 family protein [Bryobacteraceae bacterium]